MSVNGFQWLVELLSDERLGVPSVNDVSLDEFDVANCLFAIRKGNTNQTHRYFGDGYEGDGYEVELDVEIIFAVEGQAGSARDAKLEAAERVFAELLFERKGAFGADAGIDDLRLEGGVSRSLTQSGNGLPVIAIQFTVVLLFTAATPFG